MAEYYTSVYIKSGNLVVYYTDPFTDRRKKRLDAKRAHSIASRLFNGNAHVCNDSGCFNVGHGTSKRVDNCEISDTEKKNAPRVRWQCRFCTELNESYYDMCPACFVDSLESIGTHKNMCYVDGGECILIGGK